MTLDERAPAAGPPPDLSLIVPCYNEARHLRASIHSVVEVLEATGWRWDIVFVDDASQDETRALIREICAADPRCRALFHDPRSVTNASPRYACGNCVAS